MNNNLTLLHSYDVYPETRFMGSKRKLIPYIINEVSKLEYQSVLDAFSGSGCVSYMFKTLGKKVYSNDILNFSYHYANAMVANNNVILTDSDISKLIESSLNKNFVTNTFKDLYFSDEENQWIDTIRFNIDKLQDDRKKSLALSALVRACTKRRPRGIFTYVGARYDDGRKDLRTSLPEHFLNAIKLINNAVFDNNKQNRAFNENIFDLNIKADLVYMDPPYLTPNSDNDYTRRYHFIEGLARNWENLNIQEHTKTKKFEKLSDSFSKKDRIYIEFDDLFSKYKDSIMILSYSSNSIPSKEEITQMLKKYWNSVKVVEIDHVYSFGNQGHKVNNNFNHVKEYLFIAK